MRCSAATSTGRSQQQGHAGGPARRTGRRRGARARRSTGCAGPAEHETTKETGIPFSPLPAGGTNWNRQRSSNRSAEGILPSRVLRKCPRQPRYTAPEARLRRLRSARACGGGFATARICIAHIRDRAARGLRAGTRAGNHCRRDSQRRRADTKKPSRKSMTVTPLPRWRPSARLSPRLGGGCQMPIGGIAVPVTPH